MTPLLSVQTEREGAQVANVSLKNIPNGMIVRVCSFYLMTFLIDRKRIFCLHQINDKCLCDNMIIA